jgi:hypothetical protein
MWVLVHPNHFAIKYVVKMVITSCGLSKLVKGYWFNMKHNQLSKNVEHIGHTH